MLQRHELRTGGFAAKGKPLDDTQHHQQHRCPNPDLVIGGQHSHQYRRQPHHGDRGQHEVAPAQLVPQVATSDRPQRASREANPKGRQRGQQPGGGLHRGEEQLGQNGRRHRAVQGEVEPFQCRADGCGGDRPARHVRSGC